MVIMLRVYIKNIQSIETVDYTFKENAIYQVVGENSNGKSATWKVITALLSGSIERTDTRELLVRDGYQSGVMVLHNLKTNNVLTVLVDRSSSREKTILIYKKNPDDEGIKRSIRESGWDNLVKQFGLLAVCGVPITVSDSRAVTPFGSASPEQNYEMIRELSSDTVASTFIRNFEEVTYPELKKRVKSNKEKITMLDGVIESSKAVTDATLSMMYNLKGKSILPKVMYLPEVYKPLKLSIIKFVDVETLSTNRIKVIPTLVWNTVTVNNIVESIVDLNNALNQKCPTCGQSTGGLE